MRSRSPHMGWKEASRGMTTRPIGCFHSGRRGNALHHSGVRLYRPRGETVIAGRIFDPERFRGWSGSDNVGFTISVTDATPSYLPGPLPAGGWHLNAGSTEYPDPRAFAVYGKNFRLRGRTSAPVFLPQLPTTRREHRGGKETRDRSLPRSAKLRHPTYVFIEAPPGPSYPEP